MDRRTLFVLILFGLALWGAYSIYAPFLLSMVVAVLLAMATSNLTQYLAKTLRSRKLATLVMVLLLILLILAPIAYIATTGVEYLTRLDQATIREIFAKIRSLTEHIPYVNHWVDQYLQADKVTPYLKEITLYLTKMGSKGIGFVKDVVLVITFYAAVVYYQERFIALLEALIPAPARESRQMVDEVSSTMEVVIYSIIVTAVFEGFLFGIFVSYFGFDGLLFGAIYGFSSLIPVVGGALVWAPLSLYAWSELGGNVALAIAGYSVIVISVIADTFVKPIIIKMIKEQLLHVETRINELVIFFSIIAGMSTYGFWGMILGPAITTFLFAATQIYLTYSSDVE
ncbi:AI-2E family transporter [Nitratifractor sp.]|uniref:AI-2E family transporter n=1 Tax=Nitratifractor sp. TaxID=2268144 RepID=UPI0025F9AEAA|nr:AI-2E family transporter [Nitratifractor sp.]